MTSNKNQNFENCSTQELRQKAKSHGVEGHQQKSRSDLLAELGS